MTDPGTTTPLAPELLPAMLRDVFRSGVRTGVGALRARRVWPADLADPHAGYSIEFETPEGAVAAVLDTGGLKMLTDDEVARALPGLGRWQQAGGRVIAHRAGKRAVVAMLDGSFVKCAKASATRRALARAVAVDELLHESAGAPLRPNLLDSDAGQGWLRLEGATGTPLGRMLDEADPRWVQAAAEAVATGLTTLAAVSRAAVASRSLTHGLRRDDLPLHTGLQEAEILRAWTNAAALAAPMGALSGDEAARLQRRGHELAESLENHAALRPDVEAAAPAVLAHRDLHEGQILIDAADATNGAGGGVDAGGAGVGGANGRNTSGSAVTVLDWDTASWTHPALDVANLLAHVQRGGALSNGPGWHRFEESLVWALADLGHPAVTSREGREALALLRDAARLRAFAVHALRPGPLDAAMLARGTNQAPR